MSFKRLGLEIVPERRAELVKALQAHFLDYHDEDIGDLKAGLLLDFVLRTVGPAIYNQAVRDAQSYFHAKIDDLEVDVHEPETER